jgi:ABC-2 type transport system ATP-binding protein
MSSVEEICDHIALINQSKKILDGQIDDVKQRFKTNTFEVIYRGGTNDLNHGLGAHFNILEHTQTAHLNQMKIQLKSGQTNNELLKLLMNQFEIVSFNELIPSMNEVFINVVEQSNRVNKS